MPKGGDAEKALLLKRGLYLNSQVCNVTAVRGNLLHTF
jgi:hypothetical protein